MPTGVYERKSPDPNVSFWPLVDRSGECWLWTGCLTEGGYGQLSWMGKHEQAHRLAYKLEVGSIPPKIQIDHRVTCPRRCVRPSHLRLATSKQNSENRSGPSPLSRSQVHGVCWYADRGKWRVRVKHHGKVYYGGTFPLEKLAEAEQAAIDLRNSLFTHNDRDRAA